MTLDAAVPWGSQLVPFLPSKHHLADLHYSQGFTYDLNTKHYNINIYSTHLRDVGPAFPNAFRVSAFAYCTIQAAQIVLIFSFLQLSTCLKYAPLPGVPVLVDQEVHGTALQALFSSTLTPLASRIYLTAMTQIPQWPWLVQSLVTSSKHQHKNLLTAGVLPCTVRPG